MLCTGRLHFSAMPLLSYFVPIIHAYDCHFSSFTHKERCLSFYLFHILLTSILPHTHTHNSIYIIHTNRYESVNIEQRQVICKEPSAKKTLHFVYTKDIRKITKQKQMLSTAVEIFTIAHTEEREKKTRKNTMTWSVCV